MGVWKLREQRRILGCAAHMPPPHKADSACFTRELIAGAAVGALELKGGTLACRGALTGGAANGHRPREAAPRELESSLVVYFFFCNRARVGKEG